MNKTFLCFSFFVTIILLSGCSGRWQSPYTYEEDCSKKKYVHPCQTHNMGCVW